MKRIDLLVAGALAAAALLIGLGLFLPLLEVQLVGPIRYSEHNLGGKGLAAGIIALLGLCAGLNLLKPAAHPASCPSSLARAALELLSGTIFLAIYRSTLDQVMQLGPDRCGKSLVFATPPGKRASYFIVVGLAVWICGAVVALFLERK